MKIALFFSLSLLFTGLTSLNNNEAIVTPVLKKVESNANHTKSLKGKCVEVKIQFESEHNGKTWYQIQLKNSCDQKIKVTFKSKDEGETRVYRFTVDGNEQTYWMSYPSDTGDFYDLKEVDN